MVAVAKVAGSAEKVGLNVLIDPWIPLRGADGRASLASYAELLAGEKDAEDLSHPRDDVKVFVRMLLSALTQALFPVADAKAWRARLATPMSRVEVESQIAKVEADFELVGSPGFLQEKPGDENSQTGELVPDAGHELFRPAFPFRAICSRCAPALIFGAQAFAPAGGRGYSPSVRGNPPVTTLLAGSSVRVSVWANVLMGSVAERLGYAKDSKTPWRSSKEQKVGETIGLLEGLFWQPRAFALRPVAAADGGACGACGASTDLLAIIGYTSKSKVAGGSYRHPHSPAWEDVSPKADKRFRSRNLGADRPTWTGLADLLGESQGTGRAKELLPRPAPVVAQWIEYGDPDAASLLVLDVAFAPGKKKLRSRFAETFPLSLRVRDSMFVQRLRSLVVHAETVLYALRKTLAAARGRVASDGRYLADATANFWQRTEGPFWTEYDAYRTDEPPTDTFANALQTETLAIFRELTDDRTSDPAALIRTVKAEQNLRAALRKQLFPELVKHTAKPKKTVNPTKARAAGGPAQSSVVGGRESRGPTVPVVERQPPLGGP
jgi:CRISPR type I-E-associated protein CasA/Cse1